VAVRENRRIARDTFLIRLDDPETARAIRPGQFVMIRPRDGTDPLLGRPFALYDVSREGGQPAAIDIVYQVIGKGTAWLAGRRQGDDVSTWGPLGNGFPSRPGGSAVVFVAGGIGQTPFLALGRWWLGKECYGAEGEAVDRPVSSADLLYGVRTSEYLAGVDDFRRAGIGVELATDDGSAGHHGFVTDLLTRRLASGKRPALVAGCGPPPMLAAVARITAEAGVRCLLSLENHMACGFGACFSCVAPIRQADGSTDLRRVCVEGPVFDARQVVLA
jgi:dihydroorotate dehydrogenase electron transfer subunit